MSYVKCNSCDHWTDEHRIKELCGTCNNSKLVKDPKEVLCNMCANTMCPLDTINGQIPHGLSEVSVTGGYNSYHLFDMTRYTFSICEKCLRDLFVQFIIKPQLNEVDFDGMPTNEQAWQEDQTAYEFRIWKDSGGHHLAYINRKCNNIKNCPNIALYTILYSGQDFSEDCACEEHAEPYRKYHQYKITKFIPHTLKAFL